MRPGEVLPGSTGVIGEPLHMDELLGALPKLSAALDPATAAGTSRARS